MKAIQFMQIFNQMSEAQQAFNNMAQMDGFIGGRVYEDFGSYKTQTFFECDQCLPYGPLYEGSSERVVLIIDTQAKTLGVGNSYTQIAPVKSLINTNLNEEKSKSQEAKEIEIDVARIKWLESTKNTQKAFLAKDIKLFLTLQKISAELSEIHSNLLYSTVYRLAR